MATATKKAHVTEADKQKAAEWCAAVCSRIKSLYCEVERVINAIKAGELPALESRLGGLERVQRGLETAESGTSNLCISTRDVPLPDLFAK